MLDHKDIAHLIACVRAGTLVGAARSLKLSTSTLSRHIARLEDELGLALLERGRLGVRLTEAGRAILPHAELSLRELEAVRRTGRDFGSGKVGTVNLGLRFAPLGEPIPSLLRTWRARHPHVALSVVEGFDDDLDRALGERKVDLILTLAPAAPDRAAKQALLQDSLVAALPEGHRLAGNESVPQEAIRQETALVMDETFCALISNSIGTTPMRSHRVSGQTLVALAAAGFGAAIVLRSQACAPFPGVVFKPIEPAVTVDIALAWLPEREDPTIGRFIAFMRDAVRSGRPV